MLILPVPSYEQLKFMRFRDTFQQVIIKANLNYLNVNKKKKAKKLKHYWLQKSLFEECLKFFLLDGEKKSQDEIYEKLMLKQHQLNPQVYDICLRSEYLILVAQANKYGQVLLKEQDDFIASKYQLKEKIRVIFDVNALLVERVKALNYLDWAIAKKNQFFDDRIKAQDIALNQIQFNTIRQRIIENLKVIKLFLSKWLAKTEIIVI